MKFRLSSHADRDLLSILKYTKKVWGSEQGFTYLVVLSRARDKIVANPFLSGSKSRNDLAAGCRSFRCGKHFYFYRLRDDTVEIARILHESMDFPIHVGEETFI
jgi:toxin ParE1/3/4